MNKLSWEDQIRRQEQEVFFAEGDALWAKIEQQLPQHKGPSGQAPWMRIAAVLVMGFCLGLGASVGIASYASPSSHTERFIDQLEADYQQYSADDIAQRNATNDNHEALDLELHLQALDEAALQLKSELRMHPEHPYIKQQLRQNYQERIAVLQLMQQNL